MNTEAVRALADRIDFVSGPHSKEAAAVLRALMTERETVLALHTESRHLTCLECGHYWPCDTVRLLTDDPPT